jgi:ATP-dependent DNA ligase
MPSRARVGGRVRRVVGTRRVRLPEPMLLRSGRLPMSGDYAFEPKWDGFRALVSRSGRLRVKSRRGWDMTNLVPELSNLPDGLAVDGELIALWRRWPAKLPTPL